MAEPDRITAPFWAEFFGFERGKHANGGEAMTGERSIIVSTADRTAYFGHLSIQHIT